MLDAIAGNPIIAGAYTNSDGICPMLAAHRAGGRTNMISFARAWDRFVFRDARRPRARRATERELLVLRSYLEASLLADEAPSADLAAAQREHVELMRDRQTPSAPRPGDPDRRAELADRPGWAWTRLVRSYDEYEQVLHQLESEGERAGERPAAPLTLSCR